MAFSQKEKEQLLDGLMASRRQGQLGEISLRQQGKTQEADKVRDATGRLSTQIDDLIRQMMDAWLGQAGQCIHAVTTCTADLEKTIADIKKQVEIAQNVVKALGFIDDAVAIAKKALTAL